MSRFLKNFALVGALLLALGVVLSLAGLIGGGVHFLRTDGPHLNLWGFQWDGVTSGAVTENQEKLEKFDSIQVQGNALEVHFTRSSDQNYGISVKSSTQLVPPSYKIENSVLKIQSNYPDGRNNNVGNKQYQVTIFYPEDTVFDSVILNMHASEITMDHLQSQKTQIKSNALDAEFTSSSFGDFKLEGDAASIEIENCVAKMADIRLDAGDLDAENFDTSGLEIQINMGDLAFTGTLQGISHISTNIGSIELHPTLHHSQYYAVLESMFTNDYYGNKETQNKIYAQIDMGDLDLDFDD